MNEIRFEQIKPIESTINPSSISCIIQTSDGYIWLGTSSGLIRYDGIRFIIFDKINTPVLKSSSINSLFEDNLHNLWIGSDKGINILKNGMFTRFTLNGQNNDSLNEHISNMVIYKIYQDKKGVIWFGSNYLYKFENDNFTRINKIPNTTVRAITEDKRGNILIGTVSGVYIINDTSIKNYNKKDGLSDNNIRALICDYKGDIWISTRDGGINKISADGKNTVYGIKDGLPNNLVEIFFEDTENNLWLGTGGDGIVLYKDNKFTIFDSKDGLSHNFITAFYQDIEKNLWIGSSSGELNRLRHDRAKTFSKKDGLPAELVWCILEGINNDFWVGTNNGGLCRINGKKITTYNTSNALKTNIVRSLCKDLDNNIWIGNIDFGLIRFKNNKFTYFSQANGLTNRFIKSIYEDSDKNLWIGNSADLLLFQNNRFTNVSHSGPLIANVRGIKKDRKGTMWFARNGGLVKYKDDVSFFYNTQNGLKADGIMSIFIDDDDVVWIATYTAGIHRLENGRFTYISTSDGLHDDCIYEILEDGRNNLWMSSNRGIFYVNKKELNDFSTGKINQVVSHPIGKEDGLLVSECNGGNQPAGIKTSDGVLLFSTMNGVAIIDPEKFFSSLNSIPPPVVIEKLVVDDSTIVDIHNNIIFPPGKKSYGFYFAALSYVNPARNKCKYKLDGFDREWKESQPLSFVYYTNLPSGDYEFKVIGCNNDGVWNEKEAVIKFTIEPFFYQTLWFNIISILFLSGFVISIIFYRERRAKNRQKELIRIVDEKTKDLRESETKLKELNANLLNINATKDKLFSIIGHDLRGPIGTLMNYTQILTNEWDDLSEKEAREFTISLKTISENTYDLIENLLFWARNQQGRIDYKPGIIEINSLIYENINLLRPSAEKKGIKLYSEVSNSLTAYFDENMIKTVIRNLISNALKFTESGEIKISAAQESEYLVVKITDTGLGISSENQKKLFLTDQNFTTNGTSGEKGTGLGLILCREFVEKNGGRIWVESEQGKGSSFNFTLPSKKNEPLEH